MSVVVDASMAIAWLLPDERTDASTRVLAITTGSSLATRDRAMSAAATACGVTILGPLAP